MDWQPIETAPKDGTSILFFIPSARHERAKIQVGSITTCFHGGTVTIIGNMFGFDVGSPTHWMPLPAPPVQS